MCSLVMSLYPRNFIVMSLLLIKSLYHYTSGSVVFIVIPHTSACVLDGENTSTCSLIRIFNIVSKFNSMYVRITHEEQLMLKATCKQL